MVFHQKIISSGRKRRVFYAAQTVKYGGRFFNYLETVSGDADLVNQLQPGLEEDQGEWGLSEDFRSTWDSVNVLRRFEKMPILLWLGIT